MKANKKDSYSTKFTITATLVVLCFFLVYFPAKLSQYIWNRPYNLNVSYSEFNKTKVIDFSTESFHIIAIPRETSDYTNPNAKMEVKSAKHLKKSTQGLTQTAYTARKDFVNLEANKKGDFTECTDPEMRAKYRYLYEQIPSLEEEIEDNYCLKSEEDSKMGGLFVFGQTEYFLKIESTFELAHEEKADGKITCPTIQDRFYVGIAYGNTVPDFANLENPVKVSPQNFYFNPESHKNIYVDVKMRKTVINTDVNYVGDFVPIATTELFSVQEINIQREDKIDNQNMVSKEDCNVTMHLSFSFGENVIEIEREYEKLDNFIANSTGLIGFIALFLQIFIGYFESDVFDQSLIRNLYYRKDTPKMSDLPRKSYISSSERTLSKIKTIVKPEANLKTIPKENKIKKKFFLCRRKQTVTQKAMKYFEYDSDLLTIIRKTFVIEALVKVLLTEEQLDLLNLVNVRRVSKEKDTEEEILKLEERYPMAGKMNKLTQRVLEQADDIPGDDYITSRILEEIENTT